jgi:hypothetical protein
MDRRVRLRIRYDRRSGLMSLLALALLVAVFVGYLAWGQGEVAASGMQAPLTSSTGMRGYYLTQDKYNGGDANGTDGNGAGVCANGYHFASLGEIIDPSNLKYNTALGMTRTDSGQGPPTDYFGWVRTGYSGSTSTTAGQSNCDAWASPSSGDRGTYAFLPNNWTAGQDIYVWEVNTGLCINQSYVWCVADDATPSPGSGSVYLPVILQNAGP